MKRRVLAKASVFAVTPLSGCFAYTVPGELDLEVSVDAPDGVEYLHVDDSVNRGLVSGHERVEGEITIQSDDISRIDLQAIFYYQESHVDTIEKTLYSDSVSFDAGHIEEIILRPNSEPSHYNVTLTVDRI